MALPFCASRILSSEDRTAGETVPATSNQSREGKLSSSIIESWRGTVPSLQDAFLRSYSVAKFSGIGQMRLGATDRALDRGRLRNEILARCRPECGSACRRPIRQHMLIRQRLLQG